MDSPTFVTHEIIAMESGSFELFARIFESLANCESFAVTVRSHDGGGKLLSVNFWSDSTAPRPDPER